MKRISNRDGSQYTSKLKEFKGNNTFARWEKTACYVVYSYGEHFPMYACIGGIWYKNSDKYSPSTSKQQTQLSPMVECIEVDTKTLKQLIANCDKN